MTDRHKTKPLSLRLPEDLRLWVQEEAERRQIPLRRVILEAVREQKQSLRRG